jgi:hypothetical protein
MLVAAHRGRRIRLFSFHQPYGSSEKSLNYHQSMAARRKSSPESAPIAGV